MKNLKTLSSRQGRPDLSLKQRQEIFRLRKGGLGMRKIAKIVGCAASTVSDSLNHPSLNKQHKKLPWYIKGRIVHDVVRERRGRPKIQNWGLKNEKVRSYVYLKLKDKFSPKNISRQIVKDLPGESVSHEAIYQFCYTRDRTLIKYLVRCGRTKRNNRASGAKNRLREAQILKRSIDERSAEADSRAELGHLESDFVVSCRGGRSCLLVAVDRKARRVELRKLPNREAETTRRSLFQIFNGLPSAQRKSLTIDNDTAHNYLPMLEGAFREEELKVFFCAPYSPWQRGSVEAIIGIIRRWFPKGTNFDHISEDKVRYVQNWFNNRPMEVLEGLTPNEFMEREIKAAA